LGLDNAVAETDRNKAPSIVTILTMTDHFAKNQAGGSATHPTQKSKPWGMDNREERWMNIMLAN